VSSAFSGPSSGDNNSANVVYIRVYDRSLDIMPAGEYDTYGDDILDSSDGSDVANCQISRFGFYGGYRGVSLPVRNASLLQNSTVNYGLCPEV
jgi:hypothetical protein